MLLNLRANALSRCVSCKSPARPAHRVALRCTPKQPEVNILDAVRSIALSVGATTLLLAVPTPTFAADPAAETNTPSTAAPAITSSVSSISFARVDTAVTEKLRQRDENMAWKCKGVNMYDCDGELAEAAEKRFEEMANIFRGPSSK